MTVLELLSDPSKWTRSVLARDKLGHECDPMSESAVQFCILGAIRRIYEFGTSAYWEVVKRIQRELHRECKRSTYITTWQSRSTTTHADLMRVLKNANA